MRPYSRRRRIGLALGTIVGVIALSGNGQSRAANGFDPRAVTFVNLFRDTCMEHLAHPLALRSFMDAHGWKPLPSASSGYFLRGATGQAWAMTIADGNYVPRPTDRPPVTCSGGFRRKRGTREPGGNPHRTAAFRSRPPLRPLAWRSPGRFKGLWEGLQRGRQFLR